MNELLKTLIPHLGGQFERGLPVLFTGAGFSMGARNTDGEPISSAGQIREKLWNLCFPGQLLDAGSSLQHLFAHAQLRHSRQMTTLHWPRTS
jgi:hypothetical protein